MGGMSPIHWVIVLAVVLLVFGTKKLRNIGSDMGAAVKGFKDGMKPGEEKSEGVEASQQATQQVTQNVATSATASTPTSAPATGSVHTSNATNPIDAKTVDVAAKEVR